MQEACQQVSSFQQGARQAWLPPSTYPLSAHHPPGFRASLGGIYPCTFLPRVQITCTPYRRWPSLGVGREAEAQGAWGLRPPRCCLALTRSCPGQAPRATRAGGRADGEDRSKIRPAVSPSRRLSAVRRTSAHTAEGPGGPGLASP